MHLQGILLQVSQSYVIVYDSVCMKLKLGWIEQEVKIIICKVRFFGEAWSLTHK